MASRQFKYTGRPRSAMWMEYTRISNKIPAVDERLVRVIQGTDKRDSIGVTWRMIESLVDRINKLLSRVNRPISHPDDRRLVRQLEMWKRDYSYLVEPIIPIAPPLPVRQPLVERLSRAPVRHIEREDNILQRDGIPDGIQSVEEIHATRENPGLSAYLAKKSSVDGVVLDCYYIFPNRNMSVYYTRVLNDSISRQNRINAQKNPPIPATPLIRNMVPNTVEFDIGGIWHPSITRSIDKQINDFLRIHQAARVRIIPTSLFKKTDGELIAATDDSSPSYRIILGDKPVDLIRTFTRDLIQDGLGYRLSGSGWSLVTVLHIRVNITAMNPVAGRRYFRHCCPGSHIAINVANDDEYCALYSIAEHFYPRPKKSDTVSLAPRIEFCETRANGTRVTESTYLKRGEKTITKLFVAVGASRVTPTKYAESINEDPQYHEELANKFIKAKQYMDKKRAKKDYDGLDISQLYKMERIFQIRILCLGSSMMVKDRDQPAFPDEEGVTKIFNKKRYQIGAVNVLHKPSYECDVNDPLVSLYYIRTDEDDERIYVRPQEKEAAEKRKLRNKKKGEVEEIAYIIEEVVAKEEDEDSKALANGTYRNGEIKTDIKAHFLYIPKDRAGSLIHSLRGDNKTIICERCLQTVSKSMDKERNEISADMMYETHKDTCNTLSDEHIKQLWADNLTITDTLYFKDEYMRPSQPHAHSRLRYKGELDIEARLIEQPDGTRSHVPAVICLTLVDRLLKTEESVEIRSKDPYKMVEEMFSQLDMWRAKRKDITQEMVFCKDGLLHDRHRNVLDNSVTSYEARKYARMNPDIDDFAMYVDGPYHVARRAYNHALLNKDKDDIARLSEVLKTFRCAGCYRLNKKGQMEHVRCSVTGLGNATDHVESPLEDLAGLDVSCEDMIMLDEDNNVIEEPSGNNKKKQKREGVRRLVIDHDHQSGLIRGLVCVSCNNYNRVSRAIPIFAHNGSGYDYKHILSYMSDPKKDLSKPLLQTSERMRSIVYKGVFRLQDSMDFKKDSLANLVKEHHKPCVYDKNKPDRELKSPVDVWPLLVSWLNKKYNRQYEEDMERMRDYAEIYREEIANRTAEDKRMNRTGEGEPPYTGNMVQGVPDYAGNRARKNAEYHDVLRTPSGNPYHSYTYALKLDILLEISCCKGSFTYNFYDGKTDDDTGVDKDDMPHLPAAKHFDGGRKTRDRAQRIWDIFGMTKFSHYVDFYCGVDTLQLADIMLSFGDEFYKTYEIDPFHYAGISGAAMDAVLNASHKSLSEPHKVWTDMDEKLKPTHSLHSYFTEREITGGSQLLTPKIPTDPDMYNFYVGNSESTSAIRGGFSAVVHGRYCRRSKTRRMAYADWKSQYATCMTNPLPVGAYSWVDESKHKELVEEIVPLLTVESTAGYLFEVDMYLPRQHHDKYKRYPIFQENALVSNFSQYNEGVLIINEESKKNEVPNVSTDKKKKQRRGATKLIGRVDQVKNYKIAGFRLAQMLKNGVVITKIHKVSSFTCYPYLRDFMMEGYERRKLVKNEPEGAIIKLVLNSVYGKWLQRDDKFCRQKIISGEKRGQKLTKLAGNPRYKRYVKISDALGVAELSISRNIVKRPHIVGIYILELAKHMMMDLMYETLYQVFGDDVTCLYSDTDSMLILIDTTKSGIEQDDCYMWRKLHEMKYEYAYGPLNKGEVDITRDYENEPKTKGQTDTRESHLTRWFYLGNVQTEFNIIPDKEDEDGNEVYSGTYGWDFDPEEMNEYKRLTKGNDRLWCLGLEEMDSGNPEPIKEFIGLRSKLYSLVSSADAKKIKKKGVPKKYVGSHVGFCLMLGISNEYTALYAFNSGPDELNEKEYLADREGKNQKVEIKDRFVSKNMSISTMNVSKVSSSATYDKAYTCIDGISLVPWGYAGDELQPLIQKEVDFWIENGNEGLPTGVIEIENGIYQVVPSNVKR